MKKNAIDLNNPAPLYEQILLDIKSRIEKGDLKPGEQIGSQIDLCDKYGVSLITIKKALSTLIAEGVLFARIGRGTYVAEKTIKKLDLSIHKTIGLVLTDLKHPYFSMMVHSIENRAYELGFNILLSGSSGDIEKEENQINRFRELGVDGLIIASLSYEYKALDYIQKLHNENFPYLMVSYIHDPEYWYVGSDHELGGFIATEHLINLGYKSIGYVHVGKGNLLSEVRKNGYYRALTEYDLPYNSELVYLLGTEAHDTGKDRFQLGYQFGKQFAKMTNKPEAFFMYNDMIALGFIQSVNEEGIKVPDEISIVGYDDLDLAKFATVPLTTVHQPIDRLGRLAVEIIEKRIQKTDIGNRTVLKPKLVVRNSCGAVKREMNIRSSAI